MNDVTCGDSARSPHLARAATTPDPAMWAAFDLCRVPPDVRATFTRQHSISDRSEIANAALVLAQAAAELATYLDRAPVAMSQLGAVELEAAEGRARTYAAETVRKVRKALGYTYP